MPIFTGRTLRHQRGDRWMHRQPQRERRQYIPRPALPTTAVLTCSDAIQGHSHIIGIVGSPSPKRRMFSHRLLGASGLARVGWEGPKDWERGEGGCWASAHLLVQSLYLSHQMLLLLFLKNPRERTKVSFPASLSSYCPSPTPGNITWAWVLEAQGWGNGSGEP